MGAFTELSLFSGAGGGLLATKHLLGWKTICYVEWDKYAIQVLKARIKDGYLDDAPIWDNAFTFDGRPWAGLVDVITAGFPCQPFSLSGKRLAGNDPRNGWPATLKTISDVRPNFCLLENVPGLISHEYFGTIQGDLSAIGYGARWEVISAQSIGANHKRARVWIVAYPEGEGIGRVAMERKQKNKSSHVVRQGENVSNSNFERCEEFLPARVAGDAGLDTGNDHKRDEKVSNTNITGFRERGCKESNCTCGRRRRRSQENDSRSWWAVEPELARVVDGVAYRVDRIRAIGNGQVPAVVARAWERLTQ